MNALSVVNPFQVDWRGLYYEFVVGLLLCSCHDVAIRFNFQGMVFVLYFFSGGFRKEERGPLIELHRPQIRLTTVGIRGQRMGMG